MQKYSHCFALCFLKNCLRQRNFHQLCFVCVCVNALGGTFENTGLIQNAPLDIYIYIYLFIYI